MLSSRLQPVALLIGALFSVSASAGPNDALHVYGGVGWAYDDNLLRIPDNEPAFDNTRGDSWVQSEAGLIFDHMYSRQRIAATAKLSKSKFNHFKQLDYDGKDLQATWYWQLGNHLEGRLGTTYAQVLAPYTDFRSNERNLRQQRRSFFDGAWRFHPSWRARTAASTDKYTYELASQRFNNRTEDTVELEGDYLPRSGSTVGLVLRRIKGKYPFRRPIGAALLNDDFTQDELKARVEWLASGSTTVRALAGYARRDQPSFGGRTSGFNGKVDATYAPRGKISYNAAVWRDFAPLESTIVSYTRNNGASVGATWDATAKIKVDANAIYERRAYNPRATFNGGGDLRDSIRSASLRAVWSVRPAIQLSAGYVHQARSGSPVLGTGSFTSNSVSFNASAQF
ncbi:MAG: XrtB/PEP-CTERM-associated polysaccharide biosynthesis outer membrane protein EpsL [Massilia sp.]